MEIWKRQDVVKSGTKLNQFYHSCFKTRTITWTIFSILVVYLASRLHCTGSRAKKDHSNKRAFREELRIHRPHLPAKRSVSTISSQFSATYITKLRFRRSFWGAERVCTSVGSKVMTQNANIFFQTWLFSRNDITPLRNELLCQLFRALR